MKINKQMILDYQIAKIKGYEMELTLKYTRDYIEESRIIIESISKFSYYEICNT